ncbi:hypothetical protein B9Z55_021579 [Caenorhabditis nigoni]|uniref:Uncharacterized protein n=1 Tax=Caenorhabditis nigoni TaxID=1611254 RepID=A0A2G5TSN0_9PELO|nr:hypothetical protein B9Z55_021579 [Caenorhabditis nigoni]
MPIRLLSLPTADLQYTLHCMGTCELIAFSLCSKRTKTLSKSLNRKIGQPSVIVYENCIRFYILIGQSIKAYEYIPLEIFDSCIKLRGHLTGVWKRQEFTQSDWFAHILDIFNESIIQKLLIENTTPSFLDTLKRLNPKCRLLVINAYCSTKLPKIGFWKLFSNAEQVDIYINVLDKRNDISQCLSRNLKTVRFRDSRSSIGLVASDLLMNNIIYLTIDNAIITEKELIRFVKLWMKGNHRFYRPKLIELFFENAKTREEVLRGIKYQTVDNKHLLKRADGKEMLLSISSRSVIFEFRG